MTFFDGSQIQWAVDLATTVSILFAAAAFLIQNWRNHKREKAQTGIQLNAHINAAIKNFLQLNYDVREECAALFQEKTALDNRTDPGDRLNDGNPSVDEYDEIKNRFVRLIDKMIRQIELTLMIDVHVEAIALRKQQEYRDIKGEIETNHLLTLKQLHTRVSSLEVRESADRRYLRAALLRASGKKYKAESDKDEGRIKELKTSLLPQGLRALDVAFLDICARLNDPDEKSRRVGTGSDRVQVTQEFKKPR